jgi:cbb3-type cytochrome oxidase subunit 1
MSYFVIIFVIIIFIFIYLPPHHLILKGMNDYHNYLSQTFPIFFI